MKISNNLAQKSLALLGAACFALGVTACASNSQPASEKNPSVEETQKPSVEETRWLEACRADSFSEECEDALISFHGAQSMFFSLANEKDDLNTLNYITGPQNLWCFIKEGTCYARIRPVNNSNSQYMAVPTAMITEGMGEDFIYAVLEGGVSFDGNLSSWPLETTHYIKLNPGQSWRELGVDALWVAGFKVQSSQIQNLTSLQVGNASDVFSPDGPGIPLCKKSNSTSSLLIYEDCRILNEWDYIDGEYQKNGSTGTVNP